NGALRALQLGLLATAVAIYGVTQAAGDGERWAPSTTALLLLAIAVGVMIASHPSWPGAIERCLFRRGADRDARLVHALDLIRVARGAREVLAVTARGLQQAIGVSHVWILVADDAGSYVDASSGITPLSAETLLPRILDDAETAVDLAADEGLRTLLTPADRHWMTANEIELVAPMKRPDGTIGAVVAIGRKRGGFAFDRRDRWLISAGAPRAARAPRA